MTREERLAAGWRECWGVYDPGGITHWMRVDPNEPADTAWWDGPGKRYRFASKQSAERMAARYRDICPMVSARRFWRRRRGGTEALLSAAKAILAQHPKSDGKNWRALGCAVADVDAARRKRRQA